MRHFAFAVDDFVENFNPNDYKTLEEVEAELEESYDDDRELERLRAQRIAEMQQQAQAPSYGCAPVPVPGPSRVLQGPALCCQCLQ